MSPLGQEANSDQRSAVGEQSRSAGCDAHGTEPVESAVAPTTGRRYWRSLEEFSGTPEFREFMHREFPAGAADLLDSNDRRQFLKVMGASLALAGLGAAGGCRRWPDEKIAPFANRPAGRSPGSPVQYATMMEIGGVASGLLVTSYDGRPIKIEGNPEHPINRGATDAITQATVLDLYDPDRSQAPQNNGKASDWNTFAAWAKAHFAANRAGVAVLSEATSSPSLLAMKQRLQQAFPGAAWHEYEPVNNDNEINGSMMAFGAPLRAQYAFDQAQTIIALDSDFLHCEPGSVKWTRDYAQGRRADDRKTMSRLYSFETGVSITGANADHRIAIRSMDVALVAARIANLVAPEAAAGLGELASAPIASADATELVQAITHAVEDLKHRGPSIVIAGPRQPAEVHLLVHLINEALGNFGRTILFTPRGESVGHLQSIQSLAANITAGTVRTLIMLGGNPVYDAPADLKFAELLKSVQATIHLSAYADETSSQCTWHVNRAHYLETWGDARGHDGTLTIGQPLIEPLFGGRSPIELMAAVIGDEEKTGYEIVRRTFHETAGAGDFEAAWRMALHDGVVKNSALPAQPPPKAAGRNVPQAMQALQQRWSATKAGEVEVVFAADSKVFDGRFSNNGWLHELPDQISKLTWDNAIMMDPGTAAERGLRTGDMARLSVGGRQVEAAVLVLPGHAPGSVTLALGYGRQFGGRISTGAGFNAYPLRTADTMGFAQGASISATGGSYALAITQDHHAADTVGGMGTLERLPTLFREANLDEYQKNPQFVNERTHVVHRLSLWEEEFPFHSDEGFAPANYAWAMSIDLNACIGCGACTVACQAENNIPIVGKDQVQRGREMHWIRVDRYFQFKPTEFDSHGHPKAWDPNRVATFMLSPVTCMHCENAPCEQVCPVAATTHDQDGLNVMVYNRCVGTRYCSNNCPYKVRRFNYFDYHARGPLREQPGALMHVEPDYYTKGQTEAGPLRSMQFNPEVTVRMRGIMEKCTYCVQRITGARIEAKNDWVRRRNLDPAAPIEPNVRIPDGAITPACAQACPAHAIVFGDLNDPKSRVRQLHKHERSYQMLEEINTKPRTRYMAKLRNPAFGAASRGEHGHPAESAGHAESHG